MTTVMAGSQEDLALVTDCLEGKHEAFEILVGRYQSLICALMYSRCGNVAQSEDLAQETFLAAWKGLPSLKQANQFKAWLCRMRRTSRPIVPELNAGKLSHRPRRLRQSRNCVMPNLRLQAMQWRAKRRTWSGARLNSCRKIIGCRSFCFIERTNLLRESRRRWTFLRTSSASV